VKPGMRIGSQWVITSGLDVGDLVVVEGLQKVRSGIAVSPKPLPPDAPQADSPIQALPGRSGT